MYGVGVIEIVASVGVLLLPCFAPYIVAGWLGKIITNEIIKSIAIGGHTQVFWDIAFLRDFSFIIAAFGLARLPAKCRPAPVRRQAQLRNPRPHGDRRTAPLRLPMTVVPAGFGDRQAPACR